jgi:hypothetical protein
MRRFGVPMVAFAVITLSGCGGTVPSIGLVPPHHGSASLAPFPGSRWGAALQLCSSSGGAVVVDVHVGTAERFMVVVRSAVYSGTEPMEEYLFELDRLEPGTTTYTSLPLDPGECVRVGIGSGYDDPPGVPFDFTVTWSP